MTDAPGGIDVLTVTAPVLQAGPRRPGLQQASWRGVPFAILTHEIRPGRRVAVHEYPYRDKPWVEDLGRAARRIPITGFLLQNSLVYGGGDAEGQAEQMIAACEGEGSGILVHPVYGNLKVKLAEPAVISGRWDNGVRFYEIALFFIEAGDASFPATGSATQPAAVAAATAMDLAAATDFSLAINPLLPLGGLTIASVVGSVGGWGMQIKALGADARALFNLASALAPPANQSYGRFFNGANAGFLGQALANLLAAGTTIANLAATATGQRSALSAAVSATSTTAGSLGLPGNLATDLGGKIQGSLVALLATCADPADGLRVLNSLVGYVDPAIAAGQATAPPIADVHHRAIVAAMARVATTYAPKSYQDAAAVRTLVLAALDNEIQIAGDSRADNSFTALRTLRQAVIADLAARGANLAAMIQYRFNAQIPALALGQRLYRDSGRADELVGEAAPPHPLFMPRAFRALAN